MARRGEVLVTTRRLGFGGGGRREHFLVVQSDLLSGIETAVVAPLDARVDEVLRTVLSV